MWTWLIRAIIVAMFLILLEARFSWGRRITCIERDMAWLLAGLRKWGLAVPGYDEPPKLVVEPEHTQRPQEPPARK